LWLQATDRNAIAQASHRIDQVLKTNPELQGESREKGRRILLEPPLGILFRVDSQARIVYVLSVWQFA
jgi:hypothetical protein